jgi:metal-responsive CopG/Arc/MetJ family transcriptional regulator
VKTAISIPDPLFAAAEEAARELGLSRSALYVRALRRYLARYQQTGITERLNHVYGSHTAKADRALLTAQRARLARDAGPEGW